MRTVFIMSTLVFLSACAASSTPETRRAERLRELGFGSGEGYSPALYDGTRNAVLPKNEPTAVACIQAVYAANEKREEYTFHDDPFAKQFGPNNPGVLKAEAEREGLIGGCVGEGERILISPENIVRIPLGQSPNVYIKSE